MTGRNVEVFTTVIGRLGWTLYDSANRGFFTGMREERQWPFLAGSGSVLVKLALDEGPVSPVPDVALLAGHLEADNSGSGGEPDQ